MSREAPALPELMKTPPEETAVPLFGTWRKAYVTVVLAFALEVALFYALSNYFA